MCRPVDSADYPPALFYLCFVVVVNGNVIARMNFSHLNNQNPASLVRHAPGRWCLTAVRNVWGMRIRLKPPSLAQRVLVDRTIDTDRQHVDDIGSDRRSTIRLVDNTLREVFYGDELGKLIYREESMDWENVVNAQR